VLYRFTHLSGNNANHVDSVEETPILLGRDQKCQVRFDEMKDLAVSGQHAQIDEIHEGTWQIANLSKNGMLVNGVPCDETAKLPNHATIQLGKDGPRVRFDVDQNVGGVSKADVQKRKEQTKKITRGPGAMRPITEERPVFQLTDVAGPLAVKGSSKLLVLVVVGVGALAAIGAILWVVLK
jgi:pSer/pThr/pTyr-binding forkhead associated (FHA) protein